MDEGFDGVFRFTNATDEDFTAFWNNKEYLFPKQSTCPMLIPGESIENVQEIRKKFAYKLAVREFYKGKKYQEMSKMGGGIPPTFDEKILQSWIDQCLVPLPKGIVKVTEGKKMKDTDFKASKAITTKDTPNVVFKDDVPQELGQMPG